MTAYFKPVGDHDMHACVGCFKSMQENHSMSFTDTGQSLQKEIAKLAASFLLTQLMRPLRVGLCTEC